MAEEIFTLLEKLKEQHNLSDSELTEILKTDKYDAELFLLADSVRREYYGSDVYIRGLIEFTNYCKNDCLYCGIRCSNSNALRYRLTKNEIIECCHKGYSLGYRTFVLQGGEDLFYKTDDICEIIHEIKSLYPDCAVTLSIGEKSKQEYKEYFDAGADRYLLRHETADTAHYGKLHPASMSLENRMRCLYDLKEIGYQVGAGFMVGSPYQTAGCIVKDLRFLQKLMPDMIGIGPYITHNETPFANMNNGSLTLTLRLISILRLMFPYALIPATTALGTISADGRESGLKAGANVLMPNLSPAPVRGLYSIYENKICTGEEAAECTESLAKRVEIAGYHIVTDVGNVKNH